MKAEVRPVLINSLGLSSLLLSLACGPDPVYDSEIGVNAVAVEAGALAGTFALRTVSTTLIDVPLLGDKVGGGHNLRLVKRTYDEAEDVYLQTSKLCGGNNFEVAGVKTEAPQSTYLKVPESTQELLKVDHELGTYVATGHLQLWGLKDLPEPMTTALPLDRAAADKEPHRSRIFDMDEDGHIGITMKITGLVDGEVYAIQRKFIDLEGIVLGPDKTMGLSDNRYDTVVLGDDIAIYDPKDGSADKHPDPKRSWFHEVRIKEDANCDDVISETEIGRLHDERPFQ